MCSISMFFHLNTRGQERVLPLSWGAMKPTGIDTLWVHVICAWFRPEIALLNEKKMEPAARILRIPPDSFVKVETFTSWKCIHYNTTTTMSNPAAGGLRGGGCRQAYITTSI